MKNYKFAVIFVTLFLLVFTVAGRAGASMEIIFFLFILSPFLILWMVFTVLKHGRYHGRELGKDEEWGYQDVEKSKLGTFGIIDNKKGGNS